MHMYYYSRGEAEKDKVRNSHVSVVMGAWLG